MIQAMAGKTKYNWVRLRKIFITGSLSLREMAKNHNIKYSYLSQKSSEEKWFEQRDKLQREAREAVTEELLRKAEDQNEAMGQIVCKDGEAHMKRSLQTGDKLYVLFQAAVTAMTQGNIKEMRAAIDAWVVLDNQMRKIHGIEDKTDKPLVNINVMAALPTRKEMESAKVEKEAQVVEVGV